MNESERIARNIVRVGRVSSRNGYVGTVEVIIPDLDNLVVGPLPVLKAAPFPEVNEQVLCVFHGKGLEDGYCAGGFYSIHVEVVSHDRIFWRHCI